jgi:aryl carrier-like protein
VRAWPAWRLVLEGHEKLGDVKRMTLDEVDLYNLGLDSMEAARKEARWRKT